MPYFTEDWADDRETEARSCRHDSESKGARFMSGAVAPSGWLSLANETFQTGRSALRLGCSWDS